MIRSTRIAAAVATSAAIVLYAGPTLAETWIARCNNVQLNFQRDSDSFLVYFETDAGIFQVARGDIIFDNGVAVRGPVKGNDGYVGVGGAGYDGEPITQIGLNPSRQIVYVFYQHPYEDRQETGIFCETNIDKTGGETELDTATGQK